MMKIDKILSGLAPENKILNKDVKVLGISANSKDVKKGYLFVAVKGLTVDGFEFVKEAIANGASVVINEKFNKIENGVLFVKVEDTQKALGVIASNWYKNPSKKLQIIGVTGTDGKTTTSHLIYHILKSDGVKVGLVSTIAAYIGETSYDTGFHVTNPDPINLNKFLNLMVEKGCTHAVLEVTSHGIHQNRIFGISFETTVLTNITPEHLDYHKNFDEYRKVKVGFLKNALKNIVINADSSSAVVVEKSAQAKINKIKYSTIKKADVYAKKIIDVQKGLEFDCYYDKKVVRLITNLHGKYNVSNILAAVAVAGIYKVKTTSIKKAMFSFLTPKGRLEEIKNDRKLKIFVDFAHTANALENLLKYLNTIKKKRIITVFGCAGERDKLKRTKMGEISGRLSDISVFTAEDPRNEEIGTILNKMVHGAKNSNAKEIYDIGTKIGRGRYYIRIPERGEAISYAISVAKPGDIVVVTGKGHENSLAYKGYEHPWDDKTKIIENLNARQDISTIILAAGRGSRMKSDYPKILHEICGRPMISYTLENLRRAGLNKIIAVVSFRKNLVINKIKGNILFAHQKNPKGGTADAVSAGLTLLDNTSKIVIAINGDDSAFYKSGTITGIVDDHIKNKNVLTFVTLKVENPTGLGRIVRDKQGNLLGIVEEKDATDEQKKIKEVNDGLYVFDRKWLVKNIKKVKRGPQGEYYLVDLVKMAVQGRDNISTYTLGDPSEWHGVNTPEQLDHANKQMQDRLSLNS